MRSATFGVFPHLLTICLLSAGLSAAEPEVESTLAGHSYHGEAFNEGPRQAAYLMRGMGNVHFPASTENEQAQRFIDQGVAQLHGFWYYEAERSFRQAAVLDPDCAISYWGMAMANSGNRKRAQAFIEQAAERRESASPHEQLYIDGYLQYCRDEDDDGKKISKKERAQRLTRDLEEIVETYPDDIEAKAFLAVQLWQNSRADLPIVSHVAINAVLQDVFDVQPDHPAHHYRIHLWDRHKPAQALASASQCGQSSPGIAHMWHMPGHIYDRLHRYQDAVWQQEASARVDHAHMMRDRVLPDQIHNYAHNNEWLIRNLLKIGRVQDALSLARNMLELPRHPKYNSLKKGSARYGRQRLLLTLESYRLWPELLALAESNVLAPTTDAKLQIERLQWLGAAQALERRHEDTQQTLAELRRRAQANALELKYLEADERPPRPRPQSYDARKAASNEKRRQRERKSRIKELKSLDGVLETALATVETCQAAGQARWQAALDGWDDSGLSDALLKAEWLMHNKQVDESLELIQEEVSDRPGQILPLAVQAFVQYESKGALAAQETWEELRVLASQADLDTPLLARLSPLAAELDNGPHWAAQYEPSQDTGQRPRLDSLGPFRWQPYLAPDFVVQDAQGGQLRLKNLRGQPTLIIFYLGFGCLHCVEQLHEFSPRAVELRASGIDIMAISSEGVESLNKGLNSYSKPLDIPLHVDPSLSAFKAYRCFDDFESQPLHGTFLLDPDGRVLWQDISYEPFMDVDFVLHESHRLLRLAGYGDLLTAPRPGKKIASLGR